MIVAIEGHICAGKSTALTYLSQRWGLPIIHEYYTFAAGKVNYPPFPPKTEEEAKAAVDFFLHAEKERSSAARELELISHLPVVMDRSFLSILVFQKYIRDNLPGVPNAYDYALEEFQLAIDNGEIVVPDLLIALRMDSDETFLERLASRGTVPVEFLNHTDAMHYIQNYYSEVIHTQGVNGLEIDNSNLTPLETCDQMWNTILDRIVHEEAIELNHRKELSIPIQMPIDHII